MASMTLTSDTQQRTAAKACRFCGGELSRSFVDLGTSPLCESYPSAADLNRGEVHYPLHVYVCEGCFLVQLEEYESAENIFSDYAYFSSYSDSWLKHADNYCDKMTKQFGLNAQSFVVEVASNDGYLLQYFVQRNVPVLGIEPAANVAKVAQEKGVATLVRFFGTQLATELAAEGRSADLVLGNNVLAQVPDLNDFVEGLKILLKPEGVLTLEFPHLLRLIEHNEFDTIYHEHFSYFSMLTTVRILEAHGLKAFDVEELPTHGGSLRVYACRAEAKTHQVAKNVAKVIADEEKAGLASLEWLPELCAASKTDQAGARRISTGCRERGQARGRVRRPGQERDTSELLWDWKRSHRIHGGSQSLQAGSVSAGQPHPDIPPGPNPRNQAGLCRDPTLEPER